MLEPIAFQKFFTKYFNYSKFFKIFEYFKYFSKIFHQIKDADKEIST